MIAPARIPHQTHVALQNNGFSGFRDAGKTEARGELALIHVPARERRVFGVVDDERIEIDLTRVPADIDRISITVTIHDADARRQNFGMVSKAFIRCLNAEGEKEIARYDLSEDSSTETAMIFGEIYRYNGEWKFKAIGQGFNGGLGPLARSFGVNA